MDKIKGRNKAPEIKGTSMTAEQRIREKLMVALEPARLDVINESEMHAGHRGSPGTGESHFRILVVSAKFAGMSRVNRHRLVNEALADELAGRIHALALATYAPGDEIK
jgi:BolA family transcriptional regulator, general stress-responsive regulator